MKLKILLLNQAFYPDVASTAQHLTDLALALTERGHEVTVVCSRRAYGDSDKVFAPREEWRGTRVIRVGSTRFGKKAKWRRALDFGSFLCFCGARLVFMRRHDVVVALTTPPLISTLGSLFAKTRRARLCYWVMDLNPDEAVAAGWLKANSPLGRFLESLSRFSFRSAARIIALDRFMAERIAAKGIDARKISTMPPWSHDDEVRFSPQGREDFRARHGLAGRFVVMYSGNHSPCHPLDTLLRAAEILANEPEIGFCFIGGGSEFGRVKAFAAEKNLRSVLCLPYQPLNRLSDSLSAADAHVVVMGDPFVGMVHPCKIYNILTIGGAVIYVGPAAGHVPDILQRVEDRVPRVCVRHGDAEELARGIRSLAKQAGSGARQTSSARDRYSKGALLPKLVEAIENAG